MFKGRFMTKSEDVVSNYIRLKFNFHKRLKDIVYQIKFSTTN